MTEFIIGFILGVLAGVTFFYLVPSTRVIIREEILPGIRDSFARWRARRHTQ